MKSRAKFGPMTVLSVFKEMRRGSGDPRPLVGRGLARARAAARAGAARGRRARRPSSSSASTGVAVLVWVGPPDEEKLHAADRAGVPVIALSDDDALPVRARDGHRPRQAGRRLPRRGDRGGGRTQAGGGRDEPRRPPAGAAPPVCEALIASFSRRNARDRRGGVHPRRRPAGPDAEPDSPRASHRSGATASSSTTTGSPRSARSSAPASAFARLRAQLLDVVPVAGWAVKGGVAYSGTRAIGEAAVRYFEATSRFQIRPAGRFIPCG